MNNFEEAYKFIKSGPGKRKLLNSFVGNNFETQERPVFLYTAGAPGAGKTEFSRNLIKGVNVDGDLRGMVVIDADEIRKIFVDFGYNGKNSDEYRRAVNKGVEILFDNCLKYKYNALCDSTFASQKASEKNIIRNLKIDAKIMIVYVYQDPVLSWYFTKNREKKEGRKIERDFFLDSYFNSIENIKLIQNKYKDQVDVFFVKKDLKNNIEKIIVITKDDIDKYIEKKYSYKELKTIIYEN
jgi:UDP-N-acetylglucosamine kinase